MPAAVALMTLAMFAVTLGCTASQSSVDAPPAPGPDTSSPVTPDVSPPAIDTGVDQRPPADGGTVDLPGEASAETQADAPAAWPPPGLTTYLPRLETEADFNGLNGGMGVTFIIRRRANDQAYPYPWDQYECVFEAGNDTHIQFLERMDPARALQLYYGDAKRVTSSLIPGRMSVTNRDARVLIENTTSLMSVGTDYPLDATVGTFIRERLMRCAPFVRTFTFFVVCPGGTKFDCPLP